ncbi:MAG: AAA family ATPase, partial [Actinomycetota bacterium]|nr:AAA family ATPase [Actinomycetota bacterium]
MFLKSLVMRGFKSFAERTPLSFQPGISVVVGPNGSGKSNVVDAIVWVLGEQGPAALRGGRMEDVIFAGSGTKPPLGMAEVQLTIDNSARLLPVEFNEVTISRTLFRSGDSEYRINGTTCRLLDIQELLSDAGVGREQHIIVGQGRLDEILKADPQEMRTIIEEAAGVGKHRRRKERALRKIAAAESNLLHLQDLLAEIRRQLRPLRQQAEMAERHRQASEALREVRMALDARHLSRIESLLGPPDDGLEAQIDEMQARLVRVDQELSALGDEAGALRAVESTHKELQWRLATNSDRLRALQRLAAERSRTISAELSADHEAARRAHVGELMRQLEEAKAARGPAAEAELEHQEAVEGAVHRLSFARSESAEAEGRLAEAREAGGALGWELATMKAELASIESTKKSAAEERDRLKDRRERDVEKRGVLESRLARMQDVVDVLLVRRKTLVKVGARAQETMNRLRAARESLLEDLRDCEQQAAIFRARQEARLSASHSLAAQRVVRKAPPGTASVLSEVVELPDRERRALEALVGPLEGVVVATDRRAAADVSAATDPLDSLTMLVADGGGDEVEGAEPLAAKIDAAPPAAAALGRVYLADSLERAIELAGRHRDAIFLSPGGAVALGGFVLRNPSDLDAALDELHERAGSLRSELRAVEGKMAVLEEEMSRHRAESNRLEGELTQATQQNRLDELEVSALNGHIEHTESRIVDAEESIALVSARAESIRTRLSEIEDLKARSEATLRGLIEERDACVRRLDEATEHWDSARIAASKASERRTMLEERVAALEERVAAASSGLTGLDERKERLEEARRRAEAIGALARALSGGVASWAREASDKHLEAHAALAVVEERTETTRVLRDDLSADLEKMRARARNEDLARSELTVRRRILEERIREQWGLEPKTLAEIWGPVPDEAVREEGGSEDLRSLDDAALEARQLKLQRQLDALGSVNPLAAREAESLAEREEFLASQIEDVRRSRRDLLKVVHTVDEKIRDLFAAAFADIAFEYERLFGTLF